MLFIFIFYIYILCSLRDNEHIICQHSDDCIIIAQLIVAKNTFRVFASSFSLKKKCLFGTGFQFCRIVFLPTDINSQSSGVPLTTGL